MHKKCSEIQKCLSKAVDFKCRKCSGSTGDAENDGDVTLDGDLIEKGQSVPCVMVLSAVP